MRLLDLYCGAGGAAVGYYRAGFTDIVGVDIEPQKRYPFDFIQMDALEHVAEFGHHFDVIHASPPCQAFSEATPIQAKENHKDWITPTRSALKAWGGPYIIENVECARHMLDVPLKLCGTMFGLPIWRHRYFEINPRVAWLTPPCKHQWGRIAQINEKVMTEPVLCTGGGDGHRAKRKTHRPRGKVEDIRLAMGIDWMIQKELTEAIPPAYTEWIGKQLLKVREWQRDLKHGSRSSNSAWKTSRYNRNGTL